MEAGVENALDITTREAFLKGSMADDWFTNLDLFPAVGKTEVTL